MNFPAVIFLACTLCFALGQSEPLEMEERHEVENSPLASETELQKGLNRVRRSPFFFPIPGWMESKSSESYSSSHSDERVRDKIRRLFDPMGMITKRRNRHSRRNRNRNRDGTLEMLMALQAPSASEVSLDDSNLVDLKGRRKRHHH